MKAKVKLRSEKTGQEYLLLVLKINLKGLLVNYVSDLNPDDPVVLTLKPPKLGKSIELKGAVHKIVRHPNGSRGTIVRFSSGKSNQMKKLEAFIKNIKKSSTVTPSKPSIRVNPGEKTAIVKSDTLSHLSLESPDRESDFVHATMDEEALHDSPQGQGLSGQTMIARVRTTKKKPPFWKTVRFSLFILGCILGLSLLISNTLKRQGSDENTVVEQSDEQNEEQSDELTDEAIEELQKAAANSEDTTVETFEEMIPPDPVETPAVAKTALPSKKTEKASPPKASRTLTKIRVRDSGSFLKVTLRGSSELAKHRVSRTMNPKRLHMDFKDIKDFKVKRTIAVSKSPLLRIRSRKLNKGIRVSFELYPVQFPRYDIQTYDDFIDVFIYR